ncbi:hypothetical protein [uncultured Tenacibaculum sp.]|uniref:hypothetical protein n=1 Tax=uncultured Tenacibaculum sp. TaxID=174713 RepID=UPI00262A61CF|nr:hypothetical protein [uncultured Tenacibaculum sp.]
MKKSNFTYKALILLVAFVTFSFVVKNKENSNTSSSISNIKTDTSNNEFELLVVYPSGLTFFDKLQRRECILATIRNNDNSGRGFDIISVTSCPANVNAEIIKFLITSDPKGENANVSDDDDERPSSEIKPYKITPLELLNMSSNCNLVIATQNIDCTSVQGLSNSTGPQGLPGNGF